MGVSGGGWYKKSFLCQVRLQLLTLDCVVIDFLWNDGVVWWDGGVWCGM